MKTKKAKTGRAKQSSSAYFQDLRPKFLDWVPPTEEEKVLEAKARQEAREVELKRVTELAKDREAAKAAMRMHYRSAGATKKQRKRG